MDIDGYPVTTVFKFHMLKRWSDTSPGWTWVGHSQWRVDQRSSTKTIMKTTSSGVLEAVHPGLASVSATEQLCKRKQITKLSVPLIPHL